MALRELRVPQAQGVRVVQAVILRLEVGSRPMVEAVVRAVHRLPVRAVAAAQACWAQEPTPLQPQAQAAAVRAAAVGGRPLRLAVSPLLSSDLAAVVVPRQALPATVPATHSMEPQAVRRARESLPPQWPWPEALQVEISPILMLRVVRPIPWDHRASGSEPTSPVVEAGEAVHRLPLLRAQAEQVRKVEEGAVEARH